MDTSLPLHTKHRPENLNEMVGNEIVINSLKTILSRQSGEVRAFLLAGPTGTGKTTISRIIKSELKCSDRDFYEYNSSSTRGIDTIRDIAEKSRYAPVNGKVKIYLLDESHKLTNDAQNALLKLLEDTPKHVRIILSTTDPEKLIKAIRNRCSTFSMNNLTKMKIVTLLKNVCKKEKVEIGDGVLQKIAEVSEGCPRQSLVILDQIIDLPTDEEALEAIQKINAYEADTKDLLDALLKPGTKWEMISKIIKAIETDDYEKIRYMILGYMSAVLLNKDDKRVAEIIQIFQDPWYNSGKSGLVLSCYLVTKL